MSAETSSVVISICAIAAVIGVLIVLAGFLVVRIFKTSIFGLAMMVFKMFVEPKEEPSELDTRAQSVEHPRSRDLRAQAQAQGMDFDSAVARYSGQAVHTRPTTPANPIAAQNAPPVDNRPPVLRDRRRRRNNEEKGEEDADFLESFLDED
jgi:hypothetical protein